MRYECDFIRGFRLFKDSVGVSQRLLRLAEIILESIADQDTDVRLSKSSSLPQLT